MISEFPMSPELFLNSTSKFSVYSAVPTNLCNNSSRTVVKVDWECPYTREIIYSTLSRRNWCVLSPKDAQEKDLHIADFENIVWDDVLARKCAASSYLVRKGLSRKAQLSLQLRRFLSKHPESILRQAVPKTIIVETWNAFEEDMRLDIGGGFMADFDLPGMRHTPLRQKLNWTLSDVRSQMEGEEAGSELNAVLPSRWILKPSVANKGADISLAESWEDVLDALEATPDMREWVLQRYIDKPLLVERGHKFHFRVYVLCVGALKVFVFQDILMLLAAHKYCADDTEDMLCHLTNTARAAEDVEFQEEKFVKLMEDLPRILHKEQRRRFPTLAAAEMAVQQLRSQINSITADLFAAFENEYSVFCPMSNCFELFGLDFLVDEDLQVHLLEVNPGPDFKQTGGRLRKVIVQLWEQVFRLAVDLQLVFPDKSLISANEQQQWMRRLAPDFQLVYDKVWSTAHLQSNLTLV